MQTVRNRIEPKFPSRIAEKTVVPASVLLKVECRPLHRKRSKAFSTQEEAAGAWNVLVRNWGLDRMLVDPLMLNAL